MEADSVKNWSQEKNNDILITSDAPGTLSKPIKTIFFVGVPVAVILLVGGLASLIGRSGNRS